MSWWERIKEWFVGEDPLYEDQFLSEQELEGCYLTDEELEGEYVSDWELKEIIKETGNPDPFGYNERDIRDSTNEWMFEDESRPNGRSDRGMDIEF
jgi:hypothetical protein